MTLRDTRLSGPRCVVASGEPCEDEVASSACADRAISLASAAWRPPCGMKLATSSNGMASSPTLKIASGPKTKPVNKRQGLQQILDLAPQLVAVFGPDSERVYANRILLDYLGLTLNGSGG